MLPTCNHEEPDVEVPLRVVAVPKLGLARGPSRTERPRPVPEEQRDSWRETQPGALQTEQAPDCGAEKANDMLTGRAALETETARLRARHVYVVRVRARFVCRACAACTCCAALRCAVLRYASLRVARAA